jgi:hypothetical protein
MRIKRYKIKEETEEKNQKIDNNKNKQIKKKRN